MKYLLAQVLMNILIFRFASGKLLGLYKIVSYFFYPFLIFLLLLFDMANYSLAKFFEDIKASGTVGVAVDITNYYPHYFNSLLLNIILIQYIFNSFKNKISKK
jgi:hypothetical protein